jgi:Fe-S-cluster containining protein
VSPGVDLSKFECLRCGGCCSISGFVRAIDEEIEEIADYLDLSPDAIRERYTTTMGLDGGTVAIFLDHPGTTRCIFLDDENQCRIYAVRPAQCRTFPLEWRAAASHFYCMGLRVLRDDRRRSCR